MASIIRLLVLWLCIALAPGCSSSGDGEDGEGGEDAGLPGAPETMWGTYSVGIYGDWVGSCSFMLSTGAMLEDLHAEREGGWVAEFWGQYHATEITNDETRWSFFFESDVRTASGLDHQVWEFIIDERDADEEGFAGDYNYVTELSGSFDGTLRGTRQ